MNLDPPVIVLAFANDKRDPITRRYLSYLAKEAQETRQALLAAERKGLCKVELIPHATLSGIEAAFQTYGGQISIFHFAGHSDEFDLLLESWEKNNQKVDHQKFAQYLVKQKGIRLVFFNSCISKHQLPAYQAAGMPAVIYTNEYISDQKASRFALSFYRNLGHCQSIQNAFENAAALADTAISKSPAANRGFRQASSQSSETPAWEICYASEEDKVKQWNLADAAGRRLERMPAPPRETGFPPRPYKGLYAYTEKDAHIYWGRESEILRLYYLLTQENGSRVIVLSGGAGTGKTSLIEAGLLPRLRAQFEIIRFQDSFGIIAGEMNMENEGLKALMSKTLPTLIVADHWNWNTQDESQADGKVAHLLKLTSVEHQNRIAPKILISVRSEFLPQVEEILGGNYTIVHLGSPRQADIEKFVQGIYSTSDLQLQYKCSIENGLAKQIAKDLSVNQTELIFPIVQLLMQHLYAATIESGRITIASYLKTDLTHLIENFIQDEIESIYSNPNFAKISGTGLVENLLATYVDPLGNKAPQTVTQVTQRFPSDTQEMVKKLIEFLRNQSRLLTDLKFSSENRERIDCLIHDLLGPIIKKKQLESNAPGPTATRQLDKIQDLHDQIGPQVLRKLIVGLPYSPKPNELQEKVIAASRKSADSLSKKQRRRKYWQCTKLIIMLFTALTLLFADTNPLDAYAMVYLIFLMMLYRSS